MKGPQENAVHVLPPSPHPPQLQSFIHPASLRRGVEVRFLRALGQTGNLGISQGTSQDWGWFPVGDRRWIQKHDHLEPSGLSWRSGLERRAGRLCSKARSEVFPPRTRDDALVMMTSILACEMCQVRVCQASGKPGSDKAQCVHGDLKMTIRT